MDGTVVGLIIGVILAAITVFLILWGNKGDNTRINAARQMEVQTAAPKLTTAPLVEPAVKAPVKPDDLVIIEGIGPKIAGILNQKGITTFAHLAAADVAGLEKILKENGLQFAKPASWPQQARLAAEGKLDELKALQDKLTAGR
jgi:predicted flap endonuclease-1-like 5' DNA nuclease